MTYNDHIANTILHQLGGRRFIAFTGAKEFFTIDCGLRFKIGRNTSKANRVEITLNGNDLYDVKFIKFTPYSLKIDHKALTVRETQEKAVTVKEFSDIYCDCLQDIFTSVTGLVTHF